MRLGFAVKVLGDGGLPSHDTRRWRSEPHLRVSLGYLDRILDFSTADDFIIAKDTGQISTQSSRHSPKR